MASVYQGDTFLGRADLDASEILTPGTSSWGQNMGAAQILALKDRQVELYTC
jgi:hypothetical protein